MKTFKRIASVALALIMVFGSVSLLANAVETDLGAEPGIYSEISTKFFRVDPETDEWIETDRAAKGEEIRVRAYIDTDYAVGGHTLFWVYPNEFMTFQRDLYNESNGTLTSVTRGRNQIYFESEEGPVYDALFEVEVIQAEVPGGVSATDIAQKQIDNGYMTAEDFDGLGWIFLQLAGIDYCTALSDEYYAYEFAFMVNEDATGVGTFQTPEAAVMTPEKPNGAYNLNKSYEGEGGMINAKDRDFRDFYADYHLSQDATLVTTSAVTFDAGTNGKVSGTATYDIDIGTATGDLETFAVPSATANSGYKFLGWSLDGVTYYEDAANAPEGATDVKTFTDLSTIEVGYTDIALSAVYEEVEEPDPTYTVTFKHSADGEDITSVPGLASGAKLEAEEFAIAAEDLVVPEGKKFAYWTLLDGTTKVDENYAITEDITLIPYYEAITVDVTFKDSTGEDLDTISGLDYGYELTADDLDAEAELLTGVEGKTFAYWTIDGVEVKPGYIVKENVTLVPYYTANSYTVTFKHSADGEEIDNMAGLAHNYELTEDDLSIMAEELVPEAGKQFANWALEDGTDVLAGYKVTSDLVLVPEYSDIKYTVTFYADEEGTDVHEAQTEAYTYNGKLVYPTTEPAAPEGKYFDGWSVDAGTAVTADMSVTPIFTTYSYTVTFQDADGAEIDKIENVAYGTVLTAEQIAAAEAKLPSLENTGLKYTGWDNDVTAQIKSGVTFKATTAKESYTVKFVTGIDNVTVADLPVAFDEDITDKLEQLSVEGLNFKGWVTDLDTKAPAATKIADLGDDGATVTYYAYWTKTVTFVDGETETPVEVDKDASILAKAPAFAGKGDDYEAGVWYDAADGAGNELTADAKATADAAATYYAYYAPKAGLTYTIEIYEEVLGKDGEYELAETVTVTDGVADEAIEYNAARTGFKNPTLDPTAATVVASGAVAKVYYDRVDDITITVDGVPEDYEYGEEFNPEVPETTEGQEFDKWVDENGDEVKVPVEVTEDMDGLNITATYKYVITFIDQGATTKNDAQAEGAVIAAPAEKGLADHTFAGWYTAENGAGDKLAADAVVTGAATYYAHYTANDGITYTIEIYEEVLGKDGEYDLAETVTVTDGVADEAIVYNAARTGFKNPTLDPTAATVVASGAVAKVYYDRVDDITITVDGVPEDYEYGEEFNPEVPETTEGQEFDKWVDENGDEVKVPVEVTEDMDGLNITATYKYVITFIDQGATTKNDAQAEGAVIAAPAEKGLADHTFAGWYTAENGAGEKLADGAVVTGAATYYAHYTANDGLTYTIEIYEEVLGKDGEYELVETVTVTDGVAGEAIEYNEARTGFKNPTLDTTAATVVASGAVAKVKYERIDDITITVDGKPEDYEYGEELNPEVPETEDGKEFDKWVDADGNEVQVPTTVTPDMDNLELIAKYKYVITFIVDGEPVKEDAQAEGAAIVAPADPSIKGYAFGGWYTAEDGAGEKLADGAVVTGVATYYAKLTLVKNTLTFTDADGNVIGTPAEVEYGAKLNELAPAAPEVNGMTFAGWVDAATGLPMPETMPDVAATYKPSYAGNGTTKYTVETYFMDVNGNYTSKTVTTSEATLGTKVTVEDKSDENVGYYLDTEKSIMSIDKLVTGTVLKAYYAREVVTVTFVDYDGITELGSYTGLYGSKIKYPADPTREFHVFAGWDSEPTTAPVGDITIKATYDRVPVVLVNNKTTEEGLNVRFNRDDENMMYIHGFMTNDIKNQADYDRYLAVEGDGYFKVVPVANGKYGTGTKIELYDNYDGALLETYYIVIFGDVDGNADVDSNDISIVRDEAMRKTHWSNVNYENEYDAIRVLAADLVQSNGTIAANDTAAVTAHVNTTADIDQTTREVIYKKS